MALSVFSEITPLPERASGTTPDADGELWNARYTEVNLNFELLEGGVPTEFWKSGGGWAVPTGTGSANGHVVQDDGIDLTQRANLNFTGNVSAFDGTTETNVFIPNFFKNLLINGDFRINTRGYVSAATLASGEYGHVQWRAGTGGGDYSFTQLLVSTEITIAANKTLIQAVAPENVEGGAYVLSWEGTCQARYAINSATPTGAYASSPIAITGQTAGTTMSVEFGNGASAGTLGEVQLEPGTIQSDFEFLPDDINLSRCSYYLRKMALTAYNTIIYGITNGAGFRSVVPSFTPMRTDPTITLSGSLTCNQFELAGGTSTTSTVSMALFVDNGYLGFNTTNTFGIGKPCAVQFTATVTAILSAEI